MDSEWLLQVLQASEGRSAIFRPSDRETLGAGNSFRAKHALLIVRSKRSDQSTDRKNMRTVTLDGRRDVHFHGAFVPSLHLDHRTFQAYDFAAQPMLPGEYGRLLESCLRGRRHQVA